MLIALNYIISRAQYTWLRAYGAMAIGPSIVIGDELTGNLESHGNEEGRPLKIYALRVTIDEIITVTIGSYYNSYMEL
jgi:hypothetical protein